MELDLVMKNELFVGRDIDGNVILFTKKLKYREANGDKSALYSYSRYLNVRCSVAEVIERKEHYLAIYSQFDLSTRPSTFLDERGTTRPFSPVIPDNPH
jgi:hypothetical protein